MTAPSTTGLRGRTLIFAACLACAFLGILGRLTFLQVVKHDEYSRLAESQHAKTVALRPKRGPIVDRGGQVLAESSNAESLFALPHRIDDAQGLARELAPILGEPAADIVRRLDPAKRFVWVKRKLSPPVAQAVRELNAPGLGFLQESLRLYPSRELAAHVVGFEGLDGKGLGGIE
jgi:cell division protein FtsI/penicillin-binding protein 2